MSEADTPSMPATPLRVRAPRFFWRMARNVACILPVSRQTLFPAEKLAARFGPAEVEYGIRVFQARYSRLKAQGFVSAEHILEVGPGRNLTTAILMWSASATASGSSSGRITLWDVFRNMVVTPETISVTAGEILRSYGGLRTDGLFDAIDPEVLRGLSSGQIEPNIQYCVMPMNAFWVPPESDQSVSPSYDLIYSHASVEHIWRIQEFWAHACAATRDGGWHSHRVDLADHGRRESNYIEMLEYSGAAYWLTQRFVPGAINRLRAGQHIDEMIKGGLEILNDERQLRDRLPVPRSSLAHPFCLMSDNELRCTAIDVVARKSGLSNAIC
jgi:hypothetical protein